MNFNEDINIASDVYDIIDNDVAQMIYETYHKQDENTKSIIYDTMNSGYNLSILADRNEIPIDIGYYTLRRDVENLDSSNAVIMKVKQEMDEVLKYIQTVSLMPEQTFTFDGTSITDEGYNVWVANA